MWSGTKHVQSTIWTLSNFAVFYSSATCSTCMWESEQVVESETRLRTQLVMNMKSIEWSLTSPSSSSSSWSSWQSSRVRVSLDLSPSHTGILFRKYKVWLLLCGNLFTLEQGCPNPVLEGHSRGFLSSQVENASSKECGIPGESKVDLEGQKTWLAAFLKDRIWIHLP